MNENKNNDFDPSLETITLTNNEGIEFEFVIIAGISLGEKYYFILQPKEPIEGIDENEGIVFEALGERADDRLNLELVEDEEILTKVYKEYNRILDEKN